MKFQKSNLVAESKVVTPEFGELFGMYFVCEKVAKSIAENKKNEDRSLHLATLKKGIKKLNLNVSEYDINLIFNKGWKNKAKNQMSFRNIRDSVCHNCSIANRDFAIKHKTQYAQAMQAFLEEIYKFLERKRK